MGFHPYLNFGGNCREAMTRYQEILGGELEIMTMADLPPGEMEVPDDQLHLVMHASLTIGDGILMASDDPSTFEGVRGMWVNYSLADAGEAKRVFDALADGGEVSMPFGEVFWSPGFGICVDRFGTPWMVNAEPPAS